MKNHWDLTGRTSEKAAGTNDPQLYPCLFMSIQLYSLKLRIPIFCNFFFLLYIKSSLEIRTPGSDGVTNCRLGFRFAHDCSRFSIKNPPSQKIPQSQANQEVSQLSNNGRQWCHQEPSDFFFFFKLGPSDCCLLYHGCKMANALPAITSAFQVGKTRNGKRIKVFLLEWSASYSGKKAFLEDLRLHFTGQNHFTWLPLAVRAAGKTEDSWPLNNVGIRGTNSLCSGKSMYNFWHPKNLPTNSLLLTRRLTLKLNNQDTFCMF